MSLAYAPVRQANGGPEVILVSECDVTRDGVDQIIREAEAKIPGWAKANPVVRIARVRITEVKN